MQTDCDVLIAGNGLAALTLALSLPESFRIVILCKNRLDDTASRHAQGGIAAAWSGEDGIEKHVADTLEAGAGLCDEAARIYGLELGTRLEHGTWTPALKGLYSSLAFGYSKGESRSSYEGDKYVPLDTVQPAKLIAGIGYDAPGKTWGVNLLGTFARGKQAQSTNPNSYRNTGSGLTESTVEFIRVPGFGRLDLWAYWQITPVLRLDAGVQNLANKSHWLYSNARSYDASSAADWRRFQLAAQPGRSFNISLIATF